MSGTTKPLPTKPDIPDTAAEQTMCAGRWLMDQEKFENEIGLVPKTDQIIMDGKKVDMVAAYKRPAESSFDFAECGRFGYVRPTNLKVLSANRWTATMAACRLMEPPYLAKVQETVPSVKAQGLEQLQCGQFQHNFPNVQILEAHLRETSHPIPE